MRFSDFNDYELVSYAKENHEEAANIIYEKYQPFIVKYAQRVFSLVKNSGIEMNDLIQEGLLGLTSAIHHFEESKDATFYTFATTCIMRRMMSMVTSTKRLKNKILNESISLEAVDESGNCYSLEYLLSDDTKNPEKLLLSMEYQNRLLKRTKDILTSFESNVFELKINGFDYKEIADILEKDKKAIDNALQRIKLKLKQEFYS